MNMSSTSDALHDNPYWCFISYRHADDNEQDREWASWLHQEIERYEVPAELVGTRNKRGDVIPERIYPVFRDEVSLSADADRNHLLVGFSDLKIGYYQIEPFKKLELWNTVDPESLTETQTFILRVEGSFLNLASSPDRRHFISWSEYGGAQIRDVQKPKSQARILGSLHDIHQILYRPDGGAFLVLHDLEASELSVFRAGESPSLLRTIPVDFEARIWETAPDLGIVLVFEKWPNLVIDPNTGMSLASYFQNSAGMTTPGATAFRGSDESLLQRIDRSEGVERESEIDERRTGYRWRLDMAAPIRLTWDELLEVWNEEKR
jgi:hypothetical protein